MAVFADDNTTTNNDKKEEKSERERLRILKKERKKLKKETNEKRKKDKETDEKVLLQVAEKEKEDNEKQVVEKNNQVDTEQTIQKDKKMKKDKKKKKKKKKDKKKKDKKRSRSDSNQSADFTSSTEVETDTTISMTTPPKRSRLESFSSFQEEKKDDEQQQQQQHRSSSSSSSSRSKQRHSQISSSSSTTIMEDSDFLKKAKVTKVKDIATIQEQQQKQKQNKNQIISTTTSPYVCEEGARPIVESSALPAGTKPTADQHVTLLLFYQYVEPPWDESKYKQVLMDVEHIGKQAGISGRMRVAPEGLNCTLTGSTESIYTYCHLLRQYAPRTFAATEFKLTHHLPEKQRFPFLKIIPVTELVHYGLEQAKAPPIAKYHGVHLEPQDYHAKLAEPDSVVIDVRNHYEAIIGHFDPPGNNNNNEKWIDPKMRKSTEFPVWLDDPATKEKLRGKQVMMYCTGGIRCERASALLKYKMETDETVKELGIQGVYQLQGGIDKYFKEFPDGGYWKGKNYVFDKRFAHAPPEKEQIAAAAAAAAAAGNKSNQDTEKAATITTTTITTTNQPMGKCEACFKPWDMFRGKRRCPTCGVPSLICKECFDNHHKKKKNPNNNNNNKKIMMDKSWIRCDLCVEQNVTSKRQLNEKIQQQIKQYERDKLQQGLLLPNNNNNNTTKKKNHQHANNPDHHHDTTTNNNVTRLYLKNMCKKQMTQEVLLELFPEITHIVWRNDRNTGTFLGQAWVEFTTPQAAAAAMTRSGEKVLGRPLYMNYQPPDGKDAWPPASSAVTR